MLLLDLKSYRIDCCSARIASWCTHFELKIIKFWKKRRGYSDALTVHIIVNENLTVFPLMMLYDDECIQLYYFFFRSFKSAIATTIQHTWIDLILCAKSAAINTCIVSSVLFGSILHLTRIHRTQNNITVKRTKDSDKMNWVCYPKKPYVNHFQIYTHTHTPYKYY